MRPRWLHVRCRACSGTARLFTAQKIRLGEPLRSACYFCGERALDVWSGQTKADVVADWVAGAKAKGLKVKADAALDAELDAFIDADLWFRTALKQAGLG